MHFCILIEPETTILFSYSDVIIFTVTLRGWAQTFVKKATI